MKQKIVIRVLMHCEKCRSKAMKIAVCIPGVESAALTGDEKDQVEVVGEGIDSVQLTRRLRKNVGHAELVSVEAKNKEDTDKKKKEDTDKEKPEYGPLVAPPYYGFPPYYCCELREPTCTIL